MGAMLQRRTLLLSVAGLAFAGGLPGALRGEDKAALHLALKGYDPVAYFLIGEPTPGLAQFETVFDEVRYRFATLEHQQLFHGDPDRYAPQFAGACAFAVGNGVKIEANPLVWRIVDGKLYVFAGTEVPEEMDSDPQALISRAERHWPELKDQPF
jgi:hypothetical protein